jgi:hypothetical protein
MLAYTKCLGGPGTAPDPSHYKYDVFTIFGLVHSTKCLGAPGTAPDPSRYKHDVLLVNYAPK